MKKGYKQMVDEAMAEIVTITPQQADARRGNEGVVLVDLRDPRELDIEGRIEGARSCPRGMLEFWIDAESPYHKDYFSSGREFVFFCAGGLRSALAAKTAQDMGLENVSHIEGGMSAWKKAGLPVSGGKPKD